MRSIRKSSIGHVLRVIQSCDTLEQIESAQRYVYLWLKMFPQHSKAAPVFNLKLVSIQSEESFVFGGQQKKLANYWDQP